MQDNSSATSTGFSFRQGGGGPGPPAETRHSNTSAAAHNTPQHFTPASHITSAANRLISEVVQSRRRPLLGPSPG